MPLPLVERHRMARLNLLELLILNEVRIYSMNARQSHRRALDGSLGSTSSARRRTCMSPALTPSHQSYPTTIIAPTSARRQFHTTSQSWTVTSSICSAFRSALITSYKRVAQLNQIGLRERGSTKTVCRPRRTLWAITLVTSILFIS